MKRLLILFAFLCLACCLYAQSEGDLQLIKSIYFGGGSAWIDPQQVQELKEFIEAVPDIGEYDIGLSSYTDNIGGKEYNAWLSKMRSHSVLQQLIKFGVPEDRVYIEDNGQENPFYDNRTPKGRMANRRVDIVLTMIVF